MYKRSKVKMSLLLFCILVLVCILGGCASIFSAKDEQSERIVKILIVEFGSRTPIPDMKVTIKDNESGKVIDEQVANDAGEVTIRNLKNNQEYLFVPSSVYDDGTGNADGVAQSVKILDTTSYVVLETYYVRDHKGANVPVVLQNPLFPHGCEITALTSIFNFYGQEVSTETMVDHYLPREDMQRLNGNWLGPDPSKKYAGDPSNEDEGFYAFAPVIEKTAEKYIQKEKTSLKVTNITGATKKEIITKVSKGIPVMMWVTLDLSKPKMKTGWTIKGQKKPIQMYRNLHVVVMTGYQNGKVIVMDPLKGYVAHDEDRFFNSYKEMNSQAIVLEK